MIRRLLGLSFAFVLLASARGEAQAPCPATAVGCVTRDAQFQASIGPLSSMNVDTGWVPAGSPVQIRVQLYAGGNTNVKLAGDARATWPSAIGVDFVGRTGAGLFELDYGVMIDVRVRIAITILGQSLGGEWAIPIPFLPSDLRFAAMRALDDYVLTGATTNPVTISDATSRVSLVRYDVIGGLISIPGISGGFELDAQGSLTSSYRTDQIVLAPGPAITQEGERVIVPSNLGGSDYGWQLSVAARPEGRVDHALVLTLFPNFYFSLLGFDFSLDLASLPIPIGSQDRSLVFPDATLVFPLPDVQLATHTVLFGDVDVATTKERELVLRNGGTSDLTLELDQVSAGFALLSPAFVTIAPQATTTLRFAFTPDAEGAHAGTLTLLTNDPDESVVRLALSGTGIAVPMPPVYSDAGVGDAGATTPAPASRAVGSCGCRTAGASSSNEGALAALLLLAAFALRLRLARRREVSGRRP